MALNFAEDKRAKGSMNEKKLQAWKKWHNKGYKSFMITHLVGVLDFFAFTSTIAYTQLHITMPDGVKEQGTALPIWPAILVIGTMTPLSVVWSHFLWKRNESKYNKWQK
jgi:hypothetical protein